MIPAIRILYAVLTACALIQPDIARSEAWPAKPVRWIQSSAPGSSADIIGRILSDRLGAKWGLQVVSDSRPGAAGNIAAQAAARAAPDGYNYFLAVASTLAVNPYTCLLYTSDAADE